MADVPWTRAVVVGASSGVGAAIARALARDGCRVALVARRRDALEAVRDSLGTTAETPVLAHDVTQPDGVPAVVESVRSALGGLDLLVYAAGIMPRIAQDEYPFASDAAVVQTNLTGAIAWVDAVVPAMVAARRGTIVGVSSVAGDRGRRGYPAYHASKAGLDAFLESVRNRVARHGVTVVTAKPGPVDTPMTRGLERLPFLVSAEAAADAILAGARRGPGVVYVPARWRPIMLVLRAIPGWLFRRLDI